MYDVRKKMEANWWRTRATSAQVMKDLETSAEEKNYKEETEFCSSR